MNFDVKKKKIIKKILEIIVYLGVIYFLYNKIGTNISKVNFSDLNYPLLILSILIFSTHNIFNGITWDYLIRSLGNKTKLSEQIEVYIRSYIMRYIPGNVVGIMARGLYNIKYNIPVVQSLWGWFIENILYLGLAILIGSYAILSGAISSTILLVLMGFVIVVAIIMLIKSNLLEKIFNDIVIKKLASKYKDKIEDLKLDFSNKAKLQLVLRYFIAWVIYSLSYLILIKAIGVDPLERTLLFVSINALSYAIGYLSILTPSGAGVREGVMVASLSDLAGIKPEIALVIAIVARIIFIVGELTGFVFFYLFKVIKKKNEQRS